MHLKLTSPISKLPPLCFSMTLTGYQSNYPCFQRSNLSEFCLLALPSMIKT